MGTSDITGKLGVAVLNAVADDSPSRTPGATHIESWFSLYAIDPPTRISWSGQNLEDSEEWIDLAHGSLYVTRDNGFDPFGGRREERDDVEIVGQQIVYENGLLLASHDGVGVYHLVLPQDYEIEDVQYRAIGKVRYVNTRIMRYRRQVITWVFDDKIQMKVTARRHPDTVFSKRGGSWGTDPRGRPWRSREDLYDRVVKLIPGQLNSFLVRDAAAATGKGILDRIPQVVELFW